MKNDWSQLSFEVYNVFVAQKLQILEIFIDFLSSGPWPLWRPPEVAISTSATSIGYQILAEYLSFYMRHCLLVWNEIGEGLDYVFPKWVDSSPPMYLRALDARNLRILCMVFMTVRLCLVLKN